MSADKQHLSKSQIGMYLRCGEQYRRAYILGQRRPPGVAMVVGLGTHEANEHDLKNKMEWGELLAEEAVQDIAADATRRIWSEREPMRNDDDPDQGGAVDEAVSMATLYHREVAPSIEPIAVERGFRIEMEGFPYDLVGIVDVEEEARTRDTKTTGKAPAANAVATSLDADIYTLEASLRGQPKPFALDYLIKGKRPRVVTLEASKTSADHASFLRRFEAVSAGIQAGVFMPADPTSWACSPKWCGFWDDCAWGAKQSVTVGLIDPARLTTRIYERKKRAA